MLDLIRSVGPWAPFVILLAAYAETAAFLGLIVPGETVMIAGGAAAGIGGVPLALVMGCAMAGAALGDATGYYLGRRYGISLLERRRFQRFATPVEKAETFLERNGWWALILARFLSMFRAVVPFAAGAAQMPYGRFAVGNISGSILYGGAISGFGYWAGTRWERIEGIIRRGGLTLAVLAGIVAAIAFTTRWIVRHRSRVQRAFAAWREIPVVGAVLALGVTRSGRRRPFLVLLPPIGLGFALLSGFAAAGLIDWSAGEVSVIRRIQGVDSAIVSIATAVRDAETHPVVLGSIIVASVVSVVVVGWRQLALLGSSVLGTLLVSTALNGQVHRPFGPFDLELALKPNFPDATMAVAAAIAISLSWPWKANWATGAIRLGVAAGLVAALVTARAVTVSAYPVDILAGLCLGIAMPIAAGLALDPRLRKRMTTTPDSPRVDAQIPVPGVPTRERPTEL